MDDITQQAEKLGAAIAQSPQSVALHAARKELHEHKDVMQLLADLQRESQKMTELERQQKPIEVEDKRRRQAIQDQLIASDVFKNYTAAQVEYVDLMRKVNTAMGKAMGDTDED